jgi:hypothetical protein
MAASVAETHAVSHHGHISRAVQNEILALYERNWRPVDKKALDDRERDLVRRLAPPRATR